MKTRTALALVTGCALVAGGYVSIQSRDAGHAPSPEAAGAQALPVGLPSALERMERTAKVDPRTRRSLGVLRARDGRQVELHVARTADGQTCLIEHDLGGGASASCLEDGLFRHRRVEFSVAFEGGPNRFEAIRVTGLVAPGVRSAQLVLTSGEVAQLELTGERTFLYESTAADLQEGVHPAAFRLYGPAGRLVETHRFPPPGS